MNEELKKKLEYAHRILHMEGLAEDSSRGHITARGSDGRFYIKPWGVGFEDVMAGEFQGLDLDRNLLEGKGRVHSELILHLEIYRRRPEVFSVAHVHPLHSVIFSSVYKGKMHILSQYGVRFWAKVPILPSAELIQTKTQAEKLAKALGSGPAIMMRNHGITVVGESIEETVILALHFEKAAKDNLMALRVGKPTGIPLAMARKLSDNNYNPAQFKMIWEYYCKKFDRQKS
jgi:L-fuculose-phosphate aldolase